MKVPHESSLSPLPHLTAYTFLPSEIFYIDINIKAHLNEKNSLQCIYILYIDHVYFTMITTEYYPLIYLT